MHPVLLDRDGAIAIVTLNRPELRNPISDPDMVEALVATLRMVDADPAIRAAILTGAGAGFSSGGNLRRLGQPGELGGGDPIDIAAGYREGIQRIPLCFETLGVPIVAAVNGAAIGAGLDLACMCDIRIAARSARFAESFVKLGLIPGDGGAWLLQRIVGQAKAAEMTLTGDALDADEAFACGLISRVVDDAELMPAALALARRIAANPRHATRAAKRLMLQARDSRLDRHLEETAAVQALAHTSADHREAIAAFLEKRPPRFAG